MLKRLILIFFFLIVLTVSVGAVQGYVFLQNTPSQEEVQRTIEIEPGATFLEVTGLLNREGLITSSFFFRLLGKITQNESKIKPGEYQLHRAMRPAEVLGYLVRGEVLVHRVVIPEGTSSREIGAILEKGNILKAETFYQTAQDREIVKRLGFEAETLEGYLFPDTYYFSKQTAPEKIVDQMTKKFRETYDEAFQKQADALGMNQREVITLASIIEKETGTPSERRIISGVFHNRLKQKMRLQSDPTVIFSLAHFDGDIKRKDLLNDSPYNTYRVTGLPPGPISNPGKEAIYAALFPANVDYLFFVSKNNGEHFFSKTLKEHNEAVRLYQLKQKDEAMCRGCTEKSH